MIRIFNRDFMQSGRQQGRRRFKTKFIIWAEFAKFLAPLLNLSITYVSSFKLQMEM